MPDLNKLQLPREFLIVGAAARTGLFDILHKEGALTAEQIARKAEADTRAVWTVMEALVALGYIDRQEKTYKISKTANSMFYEPDSENYTGFSFMHGYNLMERWIRLPEVIKSGKPVPRSRNTNQLKHFLEAMKYNALKSASAIAARCLEGLPKGSTVLDIGGGPLSHARAFAGKGAKVTVLDLPDVVEIMEPEIKKDERITMVKGDFNEGLPEGPFDLAYLGNITHIYGKAANRLLFKRVNKVLNPGGRIAICDFIRGTGEFADVFAVNMLVNTESGGTWTWEQYSSWLKEAGFINLRWEEIGGRQVIFGEK